MKKTFTFFGASLLALFISLSSSVSATENHNGRPDNRPPDNRPPVCPGNSCKQPGTPTPAVQVGTVQGAVSGVVSGALNQHGVQQLSAEQKLDASNIATLQATQAQGDLSQKQGDQTQGLSGAVNIGATSGGNASSESGSANTTGGNATTTSGEARTTGGSAITNGGNTSTVGGQAKTESGPITQTVGAHAEGNQLKTGDVSLKDVGNAKLQSEIAVEGARQEQKAEANNQGVTGNSVHIDNRPIRQAVPAYAPPIYQQGGCPGSATSGGVSGVWGGFSLGGARIDRECQINAAETTVLQANQQIAYGSRLAARFAVRMRCKSELLGFTSEECVAMEKEIMAKFDQDEQNARRNAEIVFERARQEADSATAKKEVDAKITSTLLTQKDLEASEQRLLDALQKARLSTKLSVEVPEREFVPCPEKGCSAPKGGYYRYKTREAKAEADARMETGGLKK